MGVNKATARYYFHRLRQVLDGQSEAAGGSPVKEKLVRPPGIVSTDTFRSYNALDVSEFRHDRINHSEGFAEQQRHINGIENFWNQAKRQLSQLKQWVRREIG